MYCQYYVYIYIYIYYMYICIYVSSALRYFVAAPRLAAGPLRTVPPKGGSEKKGSDQKVTEKVTFK